MTTALTCGSHPRQLDADHQRKHAHPLDTDAVDPPELPPLCDEPEFAALMDDMVAGEAPRLFAVVQVYGERVDGRIAAWGMAFTDHAEVVSVEHTRRASLPAPENALRLFSLGSHIQARLVWFSPDATTPTADDDEAA